MAVSKKILFEELDRESRDYLSNARDRKGRGMPGVFVPRNDLSAVFLFIAGLCVLIATVGATFYVIEEEPLGVAMLETAGVLLGGWMIVAAVRIWAASKGAKYAGHFIFADAETLWECSGATVLTTELHNIVETSGVQHFSKEGKYTHTAMTVRLKSGTRSFNGNSEQRSRKLVVFLNMLAWMRSGGAGPGPEGARIASEIDYARMPAPIMGGVAKEIAEGGAMPRDFTPESLDIDIVDVPMPRKDGHASLNLLNYALIVAFAVGGVFLFNKLNVGWRDNSIWENINKFTDEDQRVPWLRLYLSESRNVLHRDEAREMLRKIYRDTASRIRSGLVQKPQQPQQPNGNFNLQPFQAFPQVDVPKINKDLVDGLSIVLMELAEQPTPIVTVSVKENSAESGAKERTSEFLKRYTYAIKEGVGDELIVFVEAPPGSTGMIDIAYDLKRANNNWEITPTVSFRKTTDGDAERNVKFRYSQITVVPAAIGNMANELGLKTAGAKKVPPPSPGDF